MCEFMGELAQENAVQVVPVHAELTTQEAASILNVSRPHMVKLLKNTQLKTIYAMTAWITRMKSTDVLQLFSIAINPATEKTVITITAIYISIAINSIRISLTLKINTTEIAK